MGNILPFKFDSVKYYNYSNTKGNNIKLVILNADFLLYVYKIIRLRQHAGVTPLNNKSDVQIILFYCVYSIMYTKSIYRHTHIYKFNKLFNKKLII